MNIIVEDHKAIYEYGLGIFETVLVEGGIPLFFDYHYQRFINGLKYYLQLNLDDDKKALLKEELRSRIIPGTYAWRYIYSEGNIYVSTRGLSEYPGDKLEISAKIRKSKEIKYQFKTTDYQERLDDLQRVRAAGFLDNIYFNDQGIVTSTAIANIFFIKDDKLYTPKLSSGVLNGTIRNVIKEGFDVSEVDYKLSDIIKLDSIFITNSLMGIMRICRVGEYKYETESSYLDAIEKYYLERKRKEIGK